MTVFNAMPEPVATERIASAGLVPQDWSRRIGPGGLNTHPQELVHVLDPIPLVEGQKEQSAATKDPAPLDQHSRDLVSGDVEDRVEGHDAHQGLVVEREVAHVTDQKIEVRVAFPRATDHSGR